VCLSPLHSSFFCLCSLCRNNLTPVQVVACDGSTGQQWDVITAGKHNNVAGQALIVSSLTQACLKYAPFPLPCRRV
jgi:hypothetical protein